LQVSADHLCRPFGVSRQAFYHRYHRYHYAQQRVRGNSILMLYLVLALRREIPSPEYAQVVFAAATSACRERHQNGPRQTALALSNALVDYAPKAVGAENEEVSTQFA
jgi:hypothetical protein